MMGAGASYQYINILSYTYPGNGIISNRDSFFVYLSETIPIGTKVHFKVPFTQLDSNVTELRIRDSAASPNDIVISPIPQLVDVEFVTTDRNTNILWCFFDANVQDTRFDKANLIVEKIVKV